jgi:Anti-sigma factor NepR
MPESKNDSKAPSADKNGNVNALITARLRGYYDSIVEEGTPDYLLELLQKLDEAERQAKIKTD